MLVMFFLTRHRCSELPRPIAVKLCHMIGNWLNFIMQQVQKFGEHSPPPKKNKGPKTCKISVDFIQPQTLIANISGKDQDIQNRKVTLTIPPAFYENVR